MVQCLESSPSPPEKCKLLTVLLFAPSELNYKILLLKISHTLVTGHRKTKMALSWKLHPSWEASMVSEGAGQAPGGAGQLINGLIQL